MAKRCPALEELHCTASELLLDQARHSMASATDVQEGRHSKKKSRKRSRRDMSASSSSGEGSEPEVDLHESLRRGQAAVRIVRELLAGQPELAGDLREVRLRPCKPQLWMASALHGSCLQASLSLEGPAGGRNV